MAKTPRPFLISLLWKALSYLISCIFIIGIVYLYLTLQLPDVEALKDAQLQVPLRIFSQDGKLLAEYGEMRRSPVPYAKIPKQLINAVLATEDQRFFAHAGVDIFGLLRATVQLISTGSKSQGGSTITMQVARNFYLSSKKTYLRKINEILLAIKIDKELSKEKILELYLNKIYFGHRAYGVAAAAQVYYGKPLEQLTLPELAMIAGLPKAPSTLNPVVNPVGAKQRRNHVLARMLEQGYINNATYTSAINTPISASYHGQPIEVEGAYVGEMVRDALFKQYGEDIYHNGYRVYTTIRSGLQDTANTVLRNGLIAYDKRHGYRRIKTNLGSPQQDQVEAWRDQLQDLAVINNLQPAAIVALKSHEVTALLANGQIITLPWQNFAWSQAQLNNKEWLGRPSQPSTIYRLGDVIRVYQASNGAWQIGQVPQVEGAFVALDPKNGAIIALAGGFSYQKSNFNRALQAERQPGSGFKPFLYAAALDKDYTLASVINDAPIVMSDGQGSWWRPQNDERKFYGPTRLRVALTKSRNLVSIRLLEGMNIAYAVNYVARFGFDPKKQPKELSLALGTGSTTPLELAAAYAVFANGGYKITPYLIDHIENAQKQIIYQAKPKIACATCDDKPIMPENNSSAKTSNEEIYAPRVISKATAFLMTSVLQDVIKLGTAQQANALQRSDLAGKTGTTNDKVDAWFTGFNSDIVATAWVGFDRPFPLGEYGSQAALPIWINFMKTALQGQPEHSLSQPAEVVSVLIDPNSGLLARDGQPNAIFEFFKTGTEPHEQAPAESEAEGNVDDGADPELQEPLF